MPLLTKFDTPGGLRDFPEGQTLEDWLDTWHNFVNGLLGPEPTRGSLGPDPSTDPREFGEFYNQHVHDVNPVGERALVWMGFPRPLLTVHRDSRQRAFELGDTRGATDEGLSTQQEYLEWHVTKDEASGGIKKVTFTTETPEYWSTLFRFKKERVLRLYRDLVSTEVTIEDLLDGDDYNPLNKWNTTHGIVHYIVQNLPNTLAAAVGLAQGSVKVSTRHFLDNFEVPGPSVLTSADPRLQIDVNALARKGLSVTGSEPIGLYIGAWDDTGWTKPDGSPVGNYWRVVRGRPGAALRLEYEVPEEEEDFLVSEIEIGGRPIRHGGHLAEHLTVMFGGLAGMRPA